MSSTADAAFGGDIEVKSLKGTECLGRPYELTVELVTQGAALGEALLEMPLTLELKFRGDDHVRLIHGVAVQVSDLLTTEHRAPLYAMTFVPRYWWLSLTRMTEIFMDMSVPEIIAAKLERAGLVNGTDFELRLQDGYPKREYVVQYDESDLDFVARLAEHLGITLFFEQGEERERVVFTDHNAGFGELAGGPVTFYARGESLGVYELRTTTSTLPVQYIVKDYNYRTPQVALKAKAPIADGQVGLRYEYGAHFKSPAEADFIGRVRAEEVACQRVRFEGQAREARFVPGSRCKLEGHAMGEPELLITEVVHDYRQTVLMHGAGGDEHGYANRFMAVHAGRPYRPPRRTPKPKIYGCITAQIEAASEGPYAETDDEGRYHVRFLFDIADAQRGRATRMVRMAQPHTGPGYGFHFPLRHGVEVLITFIDGDPDRPIISSAVPNPQTPSVVGKNNGTRNVIRTGAGNEINIDDTVGGERIKLSTPFGSSSFQLGAPNSPSSGAALSTQGSFNSVAESAVNTASTTLGLFSDIASVMASADIVAFAGGANILAALMAKGPEIIKKAAQIVDGIVDTAEKLDQADVDGAKRDATGDRNMAESLRRRRARWVADNPGKPVPKEFQQKIDASDKRAKTHDKRAERLSTVKEKNDKDRRDIKDHTKSVQVGADAAKTGMDAWTLASQVAQRAQKKAADMAAALAAGTGSGAAGVGRMGTGVPAPGSPQNIQMAANSAVLQGLSNALVAGTTSAALVGGAKAVVAGVGQAHLKSPGMTEVAGMAACLLTSGALVDIKSFGVVKCHSDALSKFTAGAAMKLEAGAAMKSRAAGDQKLTAGSSMKLSSNDAMKLESAGAIKQKAGGKVKVKAGGKFSVDAGGDASIKAPKVKCAASGARLSLSGVADLKSDGNALVMAGGTATLKGASVNIKGGPVSISGPTIKAKGRCLLG